MNFNNQLKQIWESESVANMLQRIHFQYATKKLKSLSVLSEERLEGKTTVSILLARGLSEVYKLKVLLVDLNPEGDSLLNLYLKDYTTKDGLVIGHPFSFSIFRLKDLDVNWSKSMHDSLYINRIISNLSEQVDILIVDTPNLVTQSDSFIKLNTDSNLIVSSEKILNRSEHSNKVKNDIEVNRKKLLGIIYNK
jgi:Mrp family chromosome partitioning ATPase